MPWTKVPNLAAARRIVEAAGEANGGVLIDALHFDRSDTTLAEIAAMPAARINYVQFCDGPADYDPSDAGLIEVARRARLMPGEGGIDLAGLARAIPADAVISIEIPNHALARAARAGGAGGAGAAHHAGGGRGRRRAGVNRRRRAARTDSHAHRRDRRRGDRPHPLPGDRRHRGLRARRRRRPVRLGRRAGGAVRRHALPRPPGADRGRASRRGDRRDAERDARADRARLPRGGRSGHRREAAGEQRGRGRGAARRRAADRPAGARRPPPAPPSRPAAGARRSWRRASSGGSSASARRPA